MSFEISSFNKETFLNQIRDKIRIYDESFGQYPSALVIHTMYLHFLKKIMLEINRFPVDEMTSFEGLKIIETKEEVCEVY